MTSETHVYRAVCGIELAGELYRPAGGATAPFLVDAHGGAWMMNDRLTLKTVHQQLAAGGVGVFALDFRLSDQAKYPAPVSDVSHGIRWFKKNLARLGLAPELIGGIGYSSGAQQLGLVALRPAGGAWTDPDPALEGVDASVDLFVACWPILDPLARYRKVQAEGNERLVGAHHAYFADAAAMAAGNPFGLVERGQATHTPPMLVLQGTADSNVDHARADIFADAYRTAGGSITVKKYDGLPHAFFGAQPDSAATADGIARIRDFVLSHA